MRNSLSLHGALIGFLLVGLIVATSGTAQQTGDTKIELTVNPTQIVVKGTGTPDVTTVTLKLTGPAITGGPIDLMLVLDRSASVELEPVKKIARAFIESLSSDDRVGIASFADTAQLDLALSTDRARALQIIDGLRPGVQTALGDGLMLGLFEITKNSRANAAKLIVLPTDGASNVGGDPLVQAQRAAEAKIPIFPIAMSPAARRQVLSEIARISQGLFFTSFSDDALESVLRRANRAVSARFLTITQILSEALHYEGGLEKAPLVASVGRGVLQLTWQIPLLFQGGSWQTQYRLSALREGSWAIHQPPSKLVYTDAQGRSVSLELPSATLQVGRGPGQPQPPQQPEPPSQPATPNQPPVARVTFAPEAPITGDAVKFDASSSTDPDGKITKYEWDWTNDGTFDQTTTEAAARHPFGNAGEFTVKLRITDDQDATAETTITVRVTEGLRARAAFTADFKSDPTVPTWMSYYIDDGVVTDEEVRDANARFAADVFIPGTQYRLTAEDVQAIIQINQLGKLVDKYRDVKTAETDGYVKIGTFIAEVGQLYVKEAFLRGPVAFERPPVLLYAVDSEGNLKLAGVRFIATDANATLFQVTKWASHAAAAHFEDGTEQAAAAIANAPLRNAQGSPLAFWHPTLYGLTVWVKSINPRGLFASLNPDVKQP